tara:strand:- start:362 stop:1150 length:789 start_codon:yes stop_codon:yes gene_type:complete
MEEKNKPKVLRVVISTNRVEYLEQTFESCKKIDYTGLDMYHLLIDDWPKDRNNKEFIRFVMDHGFDEVILNRENKGIACQWEKIFEIGKDFDYIFMHEDDVLVKHPFILEHLIILLQRDSHLSQVQLKRAKWYDHEEEVGPKESDWIFGDYRYERNGATPHFWGMMSIWPSSVCEENITQKTGYRLGENTIGWYFKTSKGKETGLIKTAEGGAMIEHIGEYTRGKRIMKGEPGWIDGVHDKLSDGDYYSKNFSMKYPRNLSE